MQGEEGVSPVEGESATDRLRLILGDARLARLTDSRVLVIGLGGVGSNCAESLARGGVGSLVLLDRDVVQPSNINRQAVAYHSTVGQRKTDVMARIVHDVNPDCDVRKVHMFLPKEVASIRTRILSRLTPQTSYLYVVALSMVLIRLSRDVLALWASVLELNSKRVRRSATSSYIRYSPTTL